MPWRLMTSSSAPAGSAQMRRLITNKRNHGRLLSSAANAYRSCRDIASLLDSPQNKDTTPRPVEIVAHVRSVRAQKRRAFLALGDGSTSRSLQALLDPAQAERLSTGTAIKIWGNWTPSPARGQTHELHADKIALLGAVDPEAFPIQKKYMTPEFLRTIPHLRPRTTTNALLARLRSDCEHHVSTCFRDNGFLRLHPPVITSSDCEGAGEVFTVRPRNKQTGDAGMGAANSKPEQEEEFFKTEKYLTVSNQLHLEAFVHEHQRVWSLAPTFRAEHSDTPRHLSEFYMLEGELRCTTLDEVMDVVEMLVRTVARNIQESPLGKELLAELPHTTDNPEEKARIGTLATRYRGLRRSYWPRITYTKAIEILKEAVKEDPNLFSSPPSWQSGLQIEHERYIASAVGQGSPVFVTDYPKHQKPFYMLPSQIPSDLHNDEMSSTEHPETLQRWKSHTLPAKPSLKDHLQVAHPTVACFDLLLPDLGELVGGSLREHRLKDLELAMQDGGLTNIDWYLDLRRHGSVPHGGFGLGFDRLLMYLSGVDSVRDVVQWPRYYRRCDA